MACTLDKNYNQPTTDPPVTQITVDLSAKVGDMTVETLVGIMQHIAKGGTFQRTATLHIAALKRICPHTGADLTNE